MTCTKPRRTRLPDSDGNREQLLEPRLAAEVTVLLRAQPVGDTSGGQVDVVVGEHLISADVPLAVATLDQALG